MTKREMADRIEVVDSGKRTGFNNDVQLWFVRWYPRGKSKLYHRYYETLCAMRKDVSACYDEIFIWLDFKRKEKYYGTNRALGMVTRETFEQLRKDAVRGRWLNPESFGNPEVPMRFSDHWVVEVSKGMEIKRCRTERRTDQ